MLSADGSVSPAAAGGAIGLAAAAMLATRCASGVEEGNPPAETAPTQAGGAPLKGLPPDFDADAAVSTDVPTEIHAETVPDDRRKTIVVVGLSMVGWRFCEALIQNDTAKEYRARASPVAPPCLPAAAPFRPTGSPRTPSSPSAQAS